MQRLLSELRGRQFFRTLLSLADFLQTSTIEAGLQTAGWLGGAVDAEGAHRLRI
jgi:hypothetical protein